MGQHFNENIYEIEIEFSGIMHIFKIKKEPQKKNEQKTGLTE